MKTKVQKIIAVLLIILILAGCNKESNKVKPKLELLDVPETSISKAMDQKSKQVETDNSELKQLQKADKKKKAYTIMIYMVGSNLESRNGAATKDLREIESANVDFTNNNVLVYAGGSRRWNYDVPNTANSLLDMAKEDKIIAQTDDTADMGAPETLASFINYATDNYPAEHYGLILWNHGGGPVFGYGADELFSNDSLLLQEMRTALDTTIFKDQKLDFVGFDACLMGSVELAKLWKDYASYMIASEELEAGDGWDYSFLETLNNGVEPIGVSSAIVSSYEKYYKDNQSEFYHPDATLALMDLSKTEEFASAMDELFDQINNNLDEQSYIELSRNRAESKAFGLAATSSIEESYDLLDALDFAQKYEAIYPDSVNKINKSLEEMIVTMTSNVENVNGISIYFPGDNTELYESSKKVDYYQSDSLNRLTENYSRSLISGETDWRLNEIEQSGDELTLKLTEDQSGELAKAMYTVLRRNSFGRFAYALCNIEIKPDENGILHIPSDPKLIAAVSDLSESYVPWTFVETSTSSSSKSYRSVLTYLSAGSDFTDFDSNADEKVQISIDMIGDDILIKDVIADEAAAGLAGKGSIDVSHYKTIIDGAFGAYTPSRDEEGNMKPFYEWQSSGMEYYPLDLESNFHFVTRKVSDYNAEFVVQVLCRDADGKTHASDIAYLPKRNEGITRSITTPNGSFNFRIYDDHAEMITYEGTDEILEIPETVSGLPVTVLSNLTGVHNDTIKKLTIPDSVVEIKDETFYKYSALEEVSFPEGLKKIGAAAFKYCQNLKKADLPSSLESIGRSAFARCDIETSNIPENVSYIGSLIYLDNQNLKKISVDSNNKNYKDIDGVLFSKDGTKLIEYPCGKSVSYTIPESCEEIIYGAFGSSKLEHITMNEGLKKIGNNAFFNCIYLKELELPESLEEIGERAFGDLLLFSLDKDKMTLIDNVHIGSKVKYIGQKAFNGLLIRNFDVDENNEQYGSNGGFITNKAKDTILQCPRSMGELIVIPESITTLSYSVFEDMEGAREFFIPDETFRFASRIFKVDSYDYDEDGRSIPIYNVIIHCSEGSAAEEYAEMFEYEHDEITDPELRKKERISEKTENGEMVFDVYADHAAFVGYAGEDEELIIPDTFNEKPVEEIYRRDTVDYSDRAFDASKLKRLVLPAHLKKIDTKVLNDMYNLKEIEISEDADNYVIKDKILLSKDGKQLIYLFKNEKDITLPEGIETICSYSFRSGGSIEKVVMPDSVETIEKNAMSGMYSLKQIEFSKNLKVIENSAFGSASLENIVLPESVKTLGSYLFEIEYPQNELIIPDGVESIGDSCFYSYDQQHPIKDGVIHIGKNTQIHYSSFDGLLYDSFDLNKDNPYYSVKDGFLLDKQGKKLILCPSNITGTIKVPEGVEELGSGCFRAAHGVRDIYLPDSLISIYSTAFDVHYGEEQKYDIVLHCSKDSEAARYAESNDIPWVDDN